MPRFVPALGPSVAAGLVLVGCVGGSGGEDGPDPVTLLADPCPSGPGVIPGATCLLLEVAPPGLAPKSLELRVVEADPAVPFLGSVLLCSGLNGEFFYANLPGGNELVLELAAAGLRVLDRRWVDGWLSPEYDLRAASERLAVVLDWIHANERPGGALLAVGNSGGSGELAYSLTAWGREHLLDAVVFGSGPVFSRLDYLCLPPVPPWDALCPGLVPALACGVPPCTAPFEPFCGLLAGKPAAELVQESVLFPGADTAFTTDVHVLIGSDDCSEWVPQALLFESAVTSPHTMLVLPGTPHTICESAAGRAAILQALLGSVRPPASAAPWELELLWIERGPRADERVRVRTRVR